MSRPCKRWDRGPADIRIQAYLDQAKGQLVLLSPGGKRLATLNTHPKKPQTHPGVRLTNGRGDVRLESIRIARWTGQLPKEAKEDQPRVHRVDGSIVYGRLTSFDPKRKQFTFRDGSKDEVIAQDAVGDVLLVPAAKPDRETSSPLNALLENDPQVKELRAELSLRQRGARELQNRVRPAGEVAGVSGNTDEHCRVEPEAGVA